MELLDKLRRVFANRLKFFREKRGWTQYDLAAAADMKTPTLRGYEQCNRWPDPEDIEALANALEIPAWMLFAESDFEGINAEQMASVFFQALNHPGFYSAFVNALTGFLSAKKR